MKIILQPIYFRTSFDSMFRTSFRAACAVLLLASFVSLAATTDNDDTAMLVWGKINASSKGLAIVKTTDFVDNIALPLAFQINSKAAENVSAHINIFPMQAGIDPVQIDLENGTLKPEALAILKENAKWGTKIFIENPQFMQKGKLKTMPTIGIKLN